MLVKKFLKMLGDNMYCHFCIHWNFEEGGEDTEMMIETDHIEAVEELFGNWVIAEEDSIYLTPRKDTEDEITVDLYIHKASINDEYIDENPIECPGCGADHERETPDETEHYCFYCGHHWVDEEDKEREEKNE